MSILINPYRYVAGGLTYAQEVLADSPAAYWKLDEASGAPQDSSGNANHLTVTGSPTYSQSGIPGGGGATAMYFTTGNYLSIASMPAVLQLTTWTLEAWAYWPNPNTMADSAQIICEAFAGDSNIRFALGNNTALATRRPAVGFFVGGGWKRYIDAASLGVDAWHYLAGTFDGSALRLRVNGAELGSFSTSATPAGNEALYISRRFDSTNSVNARLAHIAIYSGRLSDGRLDDHYTKGSTP